MAPETILDANTSALIDYGRSMIYYGVSNLRDGVIGLLTKAGVQVPPNVDTKTLHIMVLKMGMESNLFKKDLVSLLSNARMRGKGKKQQPAQAAPVATAPIPVVAEKTNAASVPGVINDLDEVCKGYVPGNKKSGTEFLNQDGDAEDATSDSLQFKDVLAKAFDLGIAYVASQGSRGISDEANNAALIEQARQAAAAKASRQAMYFNIFLGVTILAAGGFIWYQVKKKKA
jgi:hypothetical protein